MKKFVLLLTLCTVFGACQKEKEITPLQKKILLSKSAAIQGDDDQDNAEGSIPPVFEYCYVCHKSRPVGHTRHF